MSSNNNKKKNNFIIAGFVAVLLVILAVILIWGMAKKTSGKGEQIVTDTEEDTEAKEKWQEGTISYNGKQYRYNSSLRSYLYMGIDNDGKVTAAEDQTKGGQADALFLLIVDQKEQKMSCFWT